MDSVIDMLRRQRKEQRIGITPMEIDSVDYMKRRNAPRSDDEDWIFDGDIDLVERTVEDFRRQRISMVQSLRQYVLCYETILEWLNQQMMGRRERSGSEPRAADGYRSS